MPKVLAVDPTRCIGCSTCVLTCSALNTGVFSLERAHIVISCDDFNGNFIIGFKSTCRRCWQCALVCPSGALDAVATDEKPAEKKYFDGQ